MTAEGRRVAIALAVTAVVLSGAAFGIGKATAGSDGSEASQALEGVDVSQDVPDTPKLAAAGDLPPLRSQPEESGGSGDTTSDSTGGDSSEDLSGLDGSGGYGGGDPGIADPGGGDPGGGDPGGGDPGGGASGDGDSGESGEF